MNSHMCTHHPGDDRNDDEPNTEIHTLSPEQPPRQDDLTMPTQKAIWDKVTILVSTPRRETVSYVGLLIYIAASTLCWNQNAFWPWVALTTLSTLILILTSTLLTNKDNTTTPSARREAAPPAPRRAP